MSKYLLFAFVIILCSTGCGKSDDDLSGASEMNGKLYIENVYEAEAAKLLPGHEVFLLKDTSATATSFFFSTKSDNNGYFGMEFLKPDSLYRLHAEKRMNTAQNTNVLFTADTILRPAQRVGLVLRPDTVKQNAIYLLCADILAPPGRLPGVKIFVYSSRVLANLDSAGITGAGSSYQFISQLDGTAFRVNMPADDSLFINAELTLGSARLKCKVQGLKRLRRSGVVKDTIRLQ